MTAVRSFLARLGSPDAINWLSVVAVLIFQSCASLITSGIDFDERFGLFLTVRVSSLLVFVALLAVGKWVLTRTTSKRPQPLVTLATFLSGITASTAVFDWLLVLSGLAEQSFLVRRVLLSLVAATVILIMIALVVSTAREYELANKGLQQAIQDIRALRRDAAQRITQRRDDLLGSIQGLISEQLDQVALAGASAESVMQNLIDDVIRPLSRALGAAPTVQTQPAKNSDSAIPWRAVLRGALGGNPFTPLAFPVAIGVVVATFLVMSFGLRGALVTLGVFVIAFALNGLLRLSWRAMPQKAPLAVRLVVFTAASAPFIWLSVVVIEATTGFDLAVTSVRLVAWTLIVLSTWWVSALAVSVFSQLNEAKTYLNSTLNELKIELASLNGTDLNLRKNISRILHGPVQETVAAALRRLQTEPALSEDPAFFDSLRQRVDDALQRFDLDAKGSIDVVAELSELREVWEGSVDIEIAVDQETREQLARDIGASQVTLELIREAVHNAIKHGDARKVWVNLELNHDRRTLALVVRNDGAELPLDFEPGMGSRLFQDLTVSWERRVTPGGVEVVGIIPLLSA